MQNRVGILVVLCIVGCEAAATPADAGATPSMDVGPDASAMDAGPDASVMDGRPADDGASPVDTTVPPVDGTPMADGGAPVLGTITELAGACMRMSRLPRARCVRLSIASPGVPVMTVEVVIVDPPTGTARRGTVVFGSGGGGTGLYEIDAQASAMMQRLSTSGWTLVERGWDSPGGPTDGCGWNAGPGGMRAVSNRYATLLGWIFDSVHARDRSLAFCATGNSGGSSEVSYALAHWGREDILDLAVPTSGPPMGTLDHACLDGTNAAWLSECNALVPPATLTCPAMCSLVGAGRDQIDCAYAPDTPCAGANEADRARLLSDSVVSPTAVLSYPRTRVDFLYGRDDCGEPVTAGLYYATRVTSAHDIQFVAGAPHALFSTASGAAAIEAAITLDCVPRH